MDEHTVEVAGASVFLRRAAGPRADILYLHSVPTSSDDWSELVALTGGIAPDLPGFGRSAKAANLDYSLAGYVAFVDALLQALELPRVTIVGHGWGAAIALVFASRHPGRVARLAIVDAIPLVEGFRWPGLARWWRRPGAGELVMGSVSRRLLARTLRRGSATAGAWPDPRVDAVWEQFDQGTQRAILRLHRSVDEAQLAQLGGGLTQLAQPVLVVWGEQDPWLPAHFGDAYADRLPGARLVRVEGAGHWPWLDRPSVTETLAAFATEQP